MNGEREDLGPDSERVERVFRSLDRRPVRLAASQRAAVMARIRAVRSSAWARAWTWLSAPRLSPLAAGFALAVGIAVLLLLWPRTPSTAPVAVGTGTVPVRLVLLAPRAARVAVTGDFAGWDPEGVPLVAPRGDGLWSVELHLPPGLHHYVFIVDGTEWRPDPNAPSQVDDGFGQKNSVLLVQPPRAS